MTLLISVSTLVQHALFVFLLVVAPAWDFYDTRRLKANPTSNRKLRHYKTLVAWLWISAIAAWLAVGLRPLFTIYPAVEEIPWLWHHAWLNYLVQAIVAIFLAIVLLPLVIVVLKRLKRQPRKYSSADAFKSLSFFLPATRTERRWWVFISITAGICEEVLFRGFLLHYLHVFPWKLSLTLSLLIAAVIFGLQHLYQGAAGAASTVVVGLIFGLLFIFSGTLLLPIIFHAIMDLRLLVILRPPERTPA
ncbi:MAG TPA: CPBP family intramembrane glutamic endopeptidase [Terriglobales bacterium]|jgi:membrane protease YdiL (CAAX protease family)|nr:CPBP family intramembrane glutamic endopeptidase [Terriglobales bacterium]